MKNHFPLKHLLAFKLLAFGCAPAYADVFHYSNVLIGDRAVGLGGAYAGVSDDASGLFYNPAGLGFSIANDISGSTNAYYAKKIRYLKTIGDDHFEESSQGLMPSFFGGSQKLDSLADGLVAGFAVYSPDSELKDQNDLIKNVANIKSFHRTANIRASTLHVAGGIAKMLHPRFSIGLSTRYVMVDELVQSYQDSVLVEPSIKLKDTTQGNVYRVTTINTREHLLTHAFEPVLGAQFTIGSGFSVGVAFRYPIVLSEKFESSTDQTLFYRNEDYSFLDASEVDAEAMGDLYSRVEPLLGKIVRQAAGESNTGAPGNISLDNGLGDLPMGVRFGLAWFANSRFLWTFDIDHSFPAGEEGLAIYNRLAVTNFFTGAEYYALPSLPIRLGFFTNFDARPEVVAGVESDQPEKIDYYGSTLFVGLAQENSQIGIGGIYQLGTGKAQKVVGTKVQEVEGYIVSGVFSASHSF